MTISHSVKRHLRATWQSWRRRSRLRWRQCFVRLTTNQLDNALDQLFDAPLPLLLLHSSLSRCGYFVDGPAGVLKCFRDHAETLCLPTHTYCYTQDGETETFDPRVTLSRNGQLTNTFWRQSDVVRSVHPTHSLAAQGPRAEGLCADHARCETACGPGTPYEKLIQAEAAVLMFGVTLNTYTLFHFSEHQAGCAYLYEEQPYHLRARDGAGEVHTIRMQRQDMSVPRRFTQMRSELEAEGLLRTVTLGQGELLFLPNSRAVHEYTLEKLKRDAYYLVDRSHETIDS